jgi:hypothetical protein
MVRIKAVQELGANGGTTSPEPQSRFMIPGPKQRRIRRIVNPEEDKMFGLVRDKEKDRFYLLPGMGGRAFRRKQRVILWCAIVAGLLVSSFVAAVLFLLIS